MDSRYGRPPMPHFPLFQAPLCRQRSCQKVCQLEEGSRPRYICKACDKFCTYDDYGGVSHQNYLCDCGYYCRVVNKNDGGTFTTCAIAVCKMTRSRAQSQGYASPSKSGTAASTPSTPSTPPRFIRPSGSAQSTPYPYRPSPAVQSSSVSPTASRSRPIPSSPYQVSSTYGLRDNEFVRLLNHAATAAQRAKFPSRVLDMSSVAMALPILEAAQSSGSAPEPFRLRSSTEFERHAKVGVAGEFFVFELLRRILDGKMCQDHWKSTIRNLVREHHPNFSSLPEVTETETADIVFYDSTGALTDLLIESGYLEYRDWYDKAPEYQIEVKSTMSDRNKEFYMSEREYKLMEEYSHTFSATSRKTIYMIARVTNLRQSDVSLQLFVNPLGQGSKLKFEQSWVVKVQE